MGRSAVAQHGACPWDTGAPSPVKRFEGPSAVVDGLLYVFGGFFNTSLQASARADVYDPEADAWQQLADMPVVVTHVPLVADGQSIWFVGGYLGDNGGPPTTLLQRYETTDDTWSGPWPALPAARAGGAAVLLGRKVHFFGGFVDRFTSAGDHWVLDLDDLPAGWDTTTYAPLPVARGHHTSAVVDGKLYAIGGQFGHDVNPIDVALVDVYDPRSNTWTAVAPLPHPRSHCEAATYVDGGRIFVAGGRNNQSGGLPILQSVVAYDPATDLWEETRPLPLALTGTSVKPIGSRLFVTCGNDGAGFPTTVNFCGPLDPTVGTSVRLNGGGGAVSLERGWCQDSFFLSGRIWGAPGSPAILGTDDDELYWSHRTGANPTPNRFDYEVPVEDGAYRIGLHFAEPQWKQDGQRVFDIVLEGQLVEDDLDVHARAGALTALVLIHDVAVSDGALSLGFEAAKDRPMLSGLEVLRLPDEYGCGINPTGSLTLTGGLPQLGTQFQVGVDNPLGTQPIGSLTALALSRQPDPGFPCGTPIPFMGMGGPGAPGELLVDLQPPSFAYSQLGPPWQGIGLPSTFGFKVPKAPSLAGVRFFAQGAVVDLAGSMGIQVGLTGALELLLVP